MNEDQINEIVEVAIKRWSASCRIKQMIKKEYQILNVFIERPWQKFTFKEIKKLSKKKSESYVYNSIKRFVKEKILNQEKIGNIILKYDIVIYPVIKNEYAKLLFDSLSQINVHLNIIEQFLRKVSFTICIRFSSAYEGV